MSKKTEALKKALVALGYGSATSEYTGRTVADVLRELAVKTGAASSVENINTTGIAGVLNYIASNKGTEENEPFDLTITATHATVVVKKGTKNMTAGTDILYNGDKLKITATAEDGYTLSTLTVNGETFTSGETFVVSGHNVAIVATATA